MSQPFKIAAFVVFAAFPLLEIGLLIRVGELIGIWRLAAIIIGTVAFLHSITAGIVVVM